MVTAIARAAAQGQWRAAAWLLERIAPERWGPQRLAGGRAAIADIAGDPFAEVDELARRRRREPLGRTPGRFDLDDGIR
jgi:hypothetical protein